MLAPIVAAQEAPLALASARVSIAGTSNIHAYTASTTDVRGHAHRAGERRRRPAFWNAIAQARRVEAFEIAIRAGTLTSPKDGLDKNMHKALQGHGAPGHHVPPAPARAGEAPARCAAIGVLKIAGVEREVALDIKTDAQRLDADRAAARCRC